MGGKQGTWFCFPDKVKCSLVQARPLALGSAMGLHRVQQLSCELHTARHLQRDTICYLCWLQSQAAAMQKAVVFTV